MIEIQYSDAPQLIYISTGDGLFGPINEFVTGAPNNSITSEKIEVDGNYITTKHSTVWPDKDCDHEKTTGVIQSLPLFAGSVQRAVSTAGGYYLWQNGYTSVTTTPLPDGLMRTREFATAMLGFGSTDHILWKDALGRPIFIGCIGGSLMGSQLHTYWMSGTAQYTGAPQLKKCWEYLHCVYDLRTIRFYAGSSYHIDYDYYTASEANVPFDLSTMTDIFSVYSLIESTLNLKANRSTKIVGLSSVSNLVPRTSREYSAFLTHALSGATSDLTMDFEMRPFSELVAEAVATAPDNETNMISFIRDLRHPTSMIPKLKNLKALKSLKTMSSNYLSVNYGILPTISDLKSIYSSMTQVHYQDKLGNRVLTAGQTMSSSKGTIRYSSTRRVKLAVSREDNFVESIYQRAIDVGIFPTFNNLWDLVPYSFVIDWFVDIGSLLEKIDQKIYYSTMNIAYATTSQKYTTEINVVPSSDFPFSGSISHKGYHRRVSNHCPAPALSGPIHTRGFDHYVEAGALILQRTHK